MSNLLPNITGITVIGGCSSGIYREIYIMKKNPSMKKRKKN